MTINAHPPHRSALDRHMGFSLVEVLVAFSVLLIVIMGVFQSRLNSVRRMEQSGEMNQIQDLIRKDIASIRKEALIWKCQSGTACRDVAEYRDNPARYDVTHCQADEPLADFSIRSGPLNSDNPNIQISRVVDINGRQLDITYIDENRNAKINASTSVIPQAMNWCQ